MNAPSLTMMRARYHSWHRGVWRLAALAATLILTSCSGIQSQIGREDVTAASKSGISSLGHYYLPDPFIQVYAYRIKIGMVENIQYGIRSVGVPHTTKPIAVRHDYSFWRDDDLQVTKGPDGLLERVAMRRDPKVLEAVGAVARAVLSVVAPVPLPFKGDSGFPEFSKLVHKENYPLKELMKGTSCISLGKNKDDKEVQIKIQASLLIDDKDLRSKLEDGSLSFPIPGSEPIRGVYFRPLLPVKITITETVAGGSAVTNSEVVYCPDPTHYEKVELPPGSLAPQFFEANFAAGTLYDVRVSRKSNAFALASLPSEILGPLVSLPSSLFTVKVYHNGSESGEGDGPRVFQGGPKDPGRGSNPREKE